MDRTQLIDELIKTSDSVIEALSNCISAEATLANAYDVRNEARKALSDYNIEQSEKNATKG